MTVSLEELELWFRDRRKWLQDAARRLIQNGTLTEEDYTDLLLICKQEACGQSVTFSGIPTGGLSVADTTKPLWLESISDVQGINALSPSKPLSFGKSPLCIVYGRNGAGKSGYVRLLKHACRASQPGVLLDNIFSAAKQQQTAKITFSEDTQTKSIQWNGATISELQGVDIYDTACGLVYVNEENEVAFEPWLLRLFTQLTNTCTTLSKRIQKQINEKVSNKPVFPAEFATTTLSAWYANLTANTTKQEIEEKTAWTPDYERDLFDVYKRLAEPNPASKAIELRRQKTLVLEVMAELKKHCEGLSDGRCNTYLPIKSDAAAKRKAADEDAKKVFEKASLTGIGTETWRLLWEAARRYSEEYAYKAQPFPNISEDARCVLCHRKFDKDDKESRVRLISFETFVKGEMQQLATSAEQSLQNFVATFEELPSAETLAIKMNAAGVTDITTKSLIDDFVSQLAKRRQTCLAAFSIDEISPLPANGILIQLVQIARSILKQSRSYDKDDKGQNRPQLEQKGKELSTRKWLNQQRKAIENEIMRLNAVRLLEAAERLTNTTALSKRKSILAEELITKAYIKRFQDELKKLKASHLNVEVKKTVTDVCRVYHRISLRNAKKDVKTTDILSEGEFRIVSLAAFLADTEGRGSKTPFIFDDPISSLDQVYEDATAEQLVELTKSRQVIVFTHRLSLVSALEKYAEKMGSSHELVCLSNYVTGEITDLPIEFRKTDKAVNTLSNERLAAAKKELALGDVAYEQVAKSLCLDIRVLIERIVESDLIYEIVKRYSPEVNTLKIYHLAKITHEDCKFIDDYMTKYSRYKHSQPEESPVPLPRPEEIENDLNEIAKFIESIRKRKKS